MSNDDVDWKKCSGGMRIISSKAIMIKGVNECEDNSLSAKYDIPGQLR